MTSCERSDAPHEALRLLEERDKLERLRTAIAVGLEDVVQGRVTEWAPDRTEEILRRAAAAAGEGKKPNPDVCP